MGAKMAEIYEQAKTIGGLKATMRMAMLSQISSKQAVSDADTPDNIKKLQAALAEIKKGA
ncbi:MAG: hypothetical protein R3F48_05955 [Candidatus Zixiibacteriota bacterium]